MIQLKKALDDIISQVVEQGDPEGVLYLSGLLAEKTDISKVNDPNARNLARENLQKILFGNHNDDVQEQIKNLKPNNDNKNLNESNPLNNKNQSNILPDKNSPYEEWLNMANETQNGPSDKLMNQGLNDQDSFGQKGNKGIKQENTGYDNNKKPLYKGNGNNELNEKNNNNSPNNNNNNKKNDEIMSGNNVKDLANNWGKKDPSSLSNPQQVGKLGNNKWNTPNNEDPNQFIKNPNIPKQKLIDSNNNENDNYNNKNKPNQNWAYKNKNKNPNSKNGNGNGDDENNQGNGNGKGNGNGNSNNGDNDDDNINDKQGPNNSSDNGSTYPNKGKTNEDALKFNKKKK